MMTFLPPRWLCALVALAGSNILRDAPARFLDERWQRWNAEAR